jgi:AcrR family transcriptional regulator
MDESGTRARTRRAILAAAIAVLSKNGGASLGEIATAADVGRTTLHRYFPERSDLLRAIGVEALERVAAAAGRARLGDGPALDALVRYCHELFELGDVLTLLFADPAVMEDDLWREQTETDRELLRLVERGHADGTIDPDVPPAWAQNVLWALLYAAWELGRESGASRHNALALCVRSLRRTLTPG